MADGGYRVEQIDPPGSAEAHARRRAAQEADGLDTNKDPDYLIEGRIFDNFAPSSSNPRSIISNMMRQKIHSGQTKRVVLNLDDSGATIEGILTQLRDYPPGAGNYDFDGDVLEIMIIKDGNLTYWTPES